MPLEGHAGFSVDVAILGANDGHELRAAAAATLPLARRVHFALSALAPLPSALSDYEVVTV
jgi:hypothetical protein